MLRKRLFKYFVRFGKYLFSSSRIWTFIENMPPGTLKFEVTNIYNSNCVFCGYRFQDRPKGIMPMELYKKALNEYVSIGGRNVAPTTMVGEPLIDPFIIERIRYARTFKQIQNIYFYTNGTLLTKREGLIDDLLTSGISEIRISTAGFDPAMYERVYRSKMYEAMLRGVHQLLKRNLELGCPVRIYLELRPDKPINEVLKDPDFIQYILPLIDRTRIMWLTEYDNWGGMISSKNLMGIMRLAPIPRYRKQPCARLFSAIIMWDGKVRACSCRFKSGIPDELVIGDINNETLAEIWYSESVKQLRRRFLRGDLPEVCQKCAYYTPMRVSVIRVC